MSSEGGEVKVDTKYFDECVIAKELVLQAAKLLGVCQDIEQRHFAIVLALKDAQNGKRVELSHGLVAHKDGEYIVFAKTKRKRVRNKEVLRGRICGPRSENHENRERLQRKIA